MLRRKYKSASITSSVLDYEFENGRRYHAYKAGSYPLPNDEVRPTNSPCSAPQCRMVFSGPTLSTVPLLDPNTILTPWVWTGRAGANRHQTSCHHAPCRRAPAPRTSSQPYEDTGHWDGDGDLGNGDGGSVPRFLSDWDWSLSRPAKVVWINLSCEVMGSSPRASRADKVRVPDNVRFEIDDVESRDWTWRENYFDYIHSRFMIASISSWQALLRKAFK